MERIELSTRGSSNHRSTIELHRRYLVPQAGFEPALDSNTVELFGPKLILVIVISMTPLQQGRSTIKLLRHCYIVSNGHRVGRLSLVAGIDSLHVSQYHIFPSIIQLQLILFPFLVSVVTSINIYYL